jgi:hypothetical protein
VGVSRDECATVVAPAPTTASLSLTMAQAIAESQSMTTYAAYVAWIWAVDAQRVTS